MRINKTRQDLAEFLHLLRSESLPDSARMLERIKIYGCPTSVTTERADRASDEAVSPGPIVKDWSVDRLDFVVEEGDKETEDFTYFSICGPDVQILIPTDEGQVSLVLLAYAGPTVI